MWVYPRACGGTSVYPVSGADAQGLSPRLRGNALAIGDRVVVNGSIPALAGERELFLNLTDFVGVYPRACGGTLEIELVDLRVVGLSPRLRGNVQNIFSPSFLQGSIPALAGERPSKAETTGL